MLTYVCDMCANTSVCLCTCVCVGVGVTVSVFGICASVFKPVYTCMLR